MFTKTRRFALVTAMLWLAFGVGGRAVADLELSTPGGLSPGDTFRFVFLTDGTTTATSSNISDYNTFVTNDASTQAGGGVVTYNGVTLTWSAIASTSTVNAIDNVGQTMTPVYLADGTLVTTSTTLSGLWSGSLVQPINEDLNGKRSTTEVSVWTGTTASGVVSTDGWLGSDLPLLGQSERTSSKWVDDQDLTEADDEKLNMYGISQVLTVVPEPSTLLMAGTGISAGIAYGWFRRRRDQRRQRPVGLTDAIE